MQSPLKKLKKQEVPPSHKFTSDFDSIIFITILNSLGFFFVDFIITYTISQVIGASGVAIGLFPAFLTFGMLISASLAGYLTDRFPKRRLIMIGSFGRGASYFGLYISIIIRSLPGMYISAFALGLGAMLFWVPLDALISEKSSKYHRSSAFGRRRFALGIGQVLGTIVGFTIFALTNYFTPNNILLQFSAILIFGFANFYAGIQFSRTVDEDEKFQYSDDLSNNLDEDQNSKTIDPELLSKPEHRYSLGIILLFFALILGAINAGIYRPFVLPIIFQNVNNDPGLISWFFLPSTIIGTLIAPKLGILGDKLNPYLTVSITSFLGGIITFLIIFTQNIWIFSILLVLDNTIMLTSGFVF
ncbi:MAG: MFS transporter, partial [Promethearchaeota archaeon]